MAPSAPIAACEKSKNRLLRFGGYIVHLLYISVPGKAVLLLLRRKVLRSESNSY
jgi:hypothetical protein